MDEAVHCRMMGVVGYPTVALAVGACRCNTCAAVRDAQPVVVEMNPTEVCLQVFSSADPRGPD